MKLEGLFLFFDREENDVGKGENARHHTFLFSLSFHLFFFSNLAFCVPSLTLAIVFRKKIEKGFQRQLDIWSTFLEFDFDYIKILKKEAARCRVRLYVPRSLDLQCLQYPCFYLLRQKK